MHWMQFVLEFLVLHIRVQKRLSGFGNTLTFSLFFFIYIFSLQNWSLNFTESGNPYVTDVPLPCVQLQGLTEREVAEMDSIDVSLGSEEGLAIDLVTDGEECPDYKSDSEF